MYANKITELEEEIMQMKETYKYSSKPKLSVMTKSDKIDALKD